MSEEFLFAIFLPFLTAFIATVIATPLSLIFIKKYGIFDDPKAHKHPAIQHAVPIARGGGIPLLFGVLVTALLFVPKASIFLPLFLAAIFALIIGVLDDKLDISPYLRFFANFIVAGIVVGSGAGISIINNPFGGILHFDTMRIPFPIVQNGFIALGDILAIFWIVWVMNMLNWSKGVDGQMPGIVIISSVVIGVLSLRFAVYDQTTALSATLSFIIAGSMLGFLLFNFYPAKIFPGYGATAIYLLLAAVSILSGAKLATAILVMGVPMIDGAFTIIRRIASGKSPFWHDNKHLHHILLRLGYTHRHIALFYWSISAILGAISLTLDSKGKLFAILILVAIAGGALLFLHLALERHDEEESHI